MVRGGERALVPHVNVHCLNLGYHRPWSRELPNGLPASSARGRGRARGKILRCPGLQRFTHAGEVWRLVDLAEANDLSLFFLGARPGVAEKAAARLKEKTPGLNSRRLPRLLRPHIGESGERGRYPGGQRRQPRRTGGRFRDAAPETVAEGETRSPPEHRCHRNPGRGLRLRFERAAPGTTFFTDNGFERLARLLIEPRRLWRRYVVGNPLFLTRVLKQCLIRDRVRTRRRV